MTIDLPTPYIYNLAVINHPCLQGIAMRLIPTLKTITQEHNAYAIFVQTDGTDLPALALYAKLGNAKPCAIHFDIPIDPTVA